MSRVFVAREKRLGRTVVIKVLTRELAAGLSAERFEREIQVAARLQDPHIVPLISAGLADGLPYYTMPYVEGESLRARLKSGRVPLAQAVSILKDIAMALECAHAHGVVHRDIKPENVLLAGRTAVVTDFGIAKAISASKTEESTRTHATITQVGTSLGTPAYMAPEQASGDVVDERADIYAWGVVAYELLSGAHPFAGKTSAQHLIAAHISERPRPLAEIRASIPAALSSLVMRALEKDAEKRPQSAQEIVQALENAALIGSAGSSRDWSETSRARIWTRPRIAAALIGAALIAALPITWKRIGARSHIGETVFATKPTGGSAAAMNTIAVLPFINTGGNPQDEYFSDGMRDELAQALARLPQLRVAARTSSYAFKGKRIAAEALGDSLHVAGIIEGTVRRSGDRLRVTAQLTSAEDGLVRWSDSYESRAKDVFQVQDEFTTAIVAALAPALGGQAMLAMANASRGTNDPDAYDLYLKGRFFWAKRGSPGLKRSIEYFQKAIAKDPRFARAYAGLAMAYAVSPFYSEVAAKPFLNRAKEAAKRAVALDPALGDAHAALGRTMTLDLRLREAESELQKALDLQPNDATTHQWHGANLQAMGQVDEGLAEIRRAALLDPLSAVNGDALLYALTISRRFPEAISQASHVLELDSTFALTYHDVALAYVFSGDATSAVEAFERIGRVNPANQGSLGMMVFAYAAAGRWGDAERLRAELARQRADRSLHYVDVGSALAFGDYKRAIDEIQQSIEDRDLLYETSSPSCSPEFDPLKRDPRFVALMHGLGMHICPASSPWPITLRGSKPRRTFR